MSASNVGGALEWWKIGIDGLCWTIWPATLATPDDGLKTSAPHPVPVLLAAGDRTRGAVRWWPGFGQQGHCRNNVGGPWLRTETRGSVDHRVMSDPRLENPPLVWLNSTTAAAWTLRADLQPVPFQFGDVFGCAAWRSEPSNRYNAVRALELKVYLPLCSGSSSVYTLLSLAHSLDQVDTLLVPSSLRPAL